MIKVGHCYPKDFIKKWYGPLLKKRWKEELLPHFFYRLKRMRVDLLDRVIRIDQAIGMAVSIQGLLQVVGIKVGVA